MTAPVGSIALALLLAPPPGADTEPTVVDAAPRTHRLRAAQLFRFFWVPQSDTGGPKDLATPWFAGVAEYSLRHSPVVATRFRLGAGGAVGHGCRAVDTCADLGDPVARLGVLYASIGEELLWPLSATRVDGPGRAHSALELVVGLGSELLIVPAEAGLAPQSRGVALGLTAEVGINFYWFYVAGALGFSHWIAAPFVTERHDRTGLVVGSTAGVSWSF